MERFGSIVLGLFGPLSLQQPLAIFERVSPNDFLLAPLLS